MAPPQDDRAPFNQHRWVEIFNAGSQEIPSFGVFEVTGARTIEIGRVAVDAQRPSADALSNVGVCGHAPIPVGRSGWGTFSYPTYALYNTASTPAEGEAWGTEADAFTLKKTKSGFETVGGALTTPDRILVVRKTGSDDLLFRFTLNEDMGESTSNLADADILTMAGVELDPALDEDVVDNAGLWTRALDGAKGICMKVGDTYHILECQTKARHIRFSLTQAMATTDATRTADKEDFWDGQDPGTITSVENLDASANKAFTGASGDMGIARLDEIDNKYRIVSMEDPVNGDAVWISYTKAGNVVSHLEPFTLTTLPTSGVSHTSGIGVLCGIRVDDAGHVMSWNLDGTPSSPWGLANP